MLHFKKSAAFLMACVAVLGCIGCDSDIKIYNSARQKAVTGDSLGAIETPKLDFTITGIAEDASGNVEESKTSEPDTSRQNTDISDENGEDQSLDTDQGIAQVGGSDDQPGTGSEKPSVEPVYFYGNEWEIRDQKLILGRDNPYRLATSDFVQNVKGCTDIDIYDYLLRTHEVYYTKEYLESCPDVVLKLAKNEIYARHGRMFLDPDLYEYFLSRMWYEPMYTPEEFDDSCFNDCERANLELLLQLGA